MNAGIRLYLFIMGTLVVLDVITLLFGYDISNPVALVSYGLIAALIVKTIIDIMVRE